MTKEKDRFPDLSPIISFPPLLIEWLRQNSTNEVQFAMCFELSDFDVSKLYKLYNKEITVNRFIKTLPENSIQSDYLKFICLLGTYCGEEKILRIMKTLEFEQGAIKEAEKIYYR